MGTVFGPYPAIVESVHDGDTIKLRIDLGFDIAFRSNCRIIGMNAPELTTAAGKASRDYLKALLPMGSVVEVVSHGWDKFGARFDGDVQIHGAASTWNLTEAMIAAGHAKPWDGKGPRP